MRNRREELGYTQEDLAFRAGLNTRFIKEFELGKKTVRLDKVTDLLNFLGATLEVKIKGDTFFDSENLIEKSFLSDKKKEEFTELLIERSKRLSRPE